MVDWALKINYLSTVRGLLTWEAMQAGKAVEKHAVALWVSVGFLPAGRQ